MLIKLISVVLCALAYFVCRAFLGRLIKRLSQHKEVQPGRTAFVTQTVNMGLFMIFFSAGMVAVGVGYGEVSLFVSSFFAVVGIALFATWSILSNLTASLIIFFAFPYRVGHRIRVMDKDDDMSGLIEEISPFHVLIRRNSGDLITYPNNLILQKAVLRLDAPAVPEPVSQPGQQAAHRDGSVANDAVQATRAVRSRFRRSLLKARQ